MWRLRNGAAAAVAVMALVSCSGGASTPATTTTTIPQALWLGQANVWLGAHSSSLKDISDAAKNLGDAAKAGNGNLAQIAVTQFLTKVGEADGTLPDNAFGHDLHSVFIEYVSALATIRKGIVDNNQTTFKAGTDALAKAVADFGVITTRMNASA
ncbi:MAG TPA: hypothetical protein VNY84_02750 [Acidimicrobiales bacterium]|nr:hypothetical protein [Acidimicrobiales bacterium]